MQALFISQCTVVNNLNAVFIEVIVSNNEKEDFVKDISPKK